MIPLCENCHHGSDRHTYSYPRGGGIRHFACEVSNCSCVHYGASDAEVDLRSVGTVIPIRGADHPSFGSKVNLLSVSEICSFCGHRKLAHLDSERPDGVGACHHASDCQCPYFEYPGSTAQTVSDSIIYPDANIEIVPPIIHVKENTMDAAKFTDIITKQIERSTSLLIDKAKEYATDTDRMHNFKVAAELQGITPEQALGGFLAKHTVSIFDMIQSGKEYPIEVWNEKITDHINYLLILRALVEDK